MLLLYVLARALKNGFFFCRLTCLPLLCVCACVRVCVCVLAQSHLTATMWASREGRDGCLQLLMAARVDLEAKDIVSE